MPSYTPAQPPAPRRRRRRVTWVDLDARLGQQLLDIPIRESVAQAPADRDRDHLRWEPEPGETPTAAGVQRQLEADAPTQFLSQAHQPPPRSTRCNRPPVTAWSAAVATWTPAWKVSRLPPSQAAV